MMEWLKAILDKAEITDGVLNVEKLQKDIEAEFPKHAVPKADFNDAKEQLKTANATIETLKKDNKDNEALQQEITGYKAKVSSLEKAAEDTRKTYALKEKLRDSGVMDPDYIIYKQGGLEKFTFDKDGAPVGLDDVLKPLKESSPHLFKSQPAGYSPAGGGQLPIKNPWAKETFNLTEQGRIFRENPAVARQMAEAAGAKL